jgi:hypothetical protein
MQERVIGDVDRETWNLMQDQQRRVYSEVPNLTSR